MMEAAQMREPMARALTLSSQRQAAQAQAAVALRRALLVAASGFSPALP